MTGTMGTSPFDRLRAGLTIRRLRLATGLVLLAYVLSHLVNHALGNVSLGAMEAALDGIAGFWTGRPVSWLLYGSLTVHAGLGVWALYARPRFQWTLVEAAQLALGIALPPLLVGHVVSTKLAGVLYGTTTSYATTLHTFFVLSPSTGSWQAAALIVAWTHGCIGLWHWLRLKPAFPRWSALLLCAAVLVPVLSLLGYWHAGRAVLALAADPAWRIEHTPPSPDQSAAIADRIATLDRLQAQILWGFASAVGLALAGRAARRGLGHRRGRVRIAYPDGRVARIPRGGTVLEASRSLGLPHASVCGGRGRCSTCRVRIFGEPGRHGAPAPAERAVLDRVGAAPGVRLACQFRPAHDVQVAPLVPPGAASAEARRGSLRSGEERFVVALFVDMRGSTRMAEDRLPFDTVFLINRFLEAVARAVSREGGAPNQFLGDGMMALFGLAASPKDAARAALAATAAIGEEIGALNALLRHDLPEPIRFGIGVAAGTAVLGEIGGHESGHRVFTAIGDPVNVAARLQGTTKRLGIEALVAELVYETAGAEPPRPAEAVAVDGRDGAVLAVALRRAAVAVRSGDGILLPGPRELA